MGKKFEKAKSRSAETSNKVNEIRKTGREIAREKTRQAEAIRQTPEGLDDEVREGVEALKGGIVNDASRDFKENVEKPIEEGKKEFEKINEDAGENAQLAEQAGAAIKEASGEKGYAAKEIERAGTEAENSKKGFENIIEGNEAMAKEADEDKAAQEDVITAKI
jgi:hypothetical protein